MLLTLRGKEYNIYLQYTVEPRFYDRRSNDIPYLTINILCPGKGYSKFCERVMINIYNLTARNHWNRNILIRSIVINKDNKRVFQLFNLQQSSTELT